MKLRVFLVCTVVCLSAWPLAGADTAPKGDVLLATMQKELERANTALSGADPKPYFVSYSALDQEQMAVVAAHGALITSVSAHRRTGTVREVVLDSAPHIHPALRASRAVFCPFSGAVTRNGDSCHGNASSGLGDSVIERAGARLPYGTSTDDPPSWK